MRGARLVQWCELFGVAEGTARVALSRMVERGELRSDNGTYELAGRTQTRRAAQDWSLTPKLGAWNGDWLLAVVDARSRSAEERGAMRDAMRHVRFAEVREGLWTRPDNLPRASAAPEWWDVVDGQCTWWTARPEGDAAALAFEIFEAQQWADAASTATAALGSATRALVGSGDDALATAFVAGASALTHVRADPMLPAELVDPAAGTALRAAYVAWENAFSAAVRAWFRASR
jgi:phenylacetic acid degradation operon negative regulatory protein